MSEQRTSAEFEAEAARLRAQLLVYCYRMMGSVTDAEDLVQETYLRAFRGLESFEGRSSMRTWLYRIATNLCLNAARGARRVVPRDLSSEPGEPEAALNRRDDLPWVEPLPEAWLQSSARPTPEEERLTRENLTLAWICAAQRLTPKQRAALVLRDVLDMSAEEAAEALGVTTATVNSALQRARAALEGVQSERAKPEPEVEERAVRRFIDAFVAHDFDAVVASMTESAIWQMPPFDRFYVGGLAAARLSWTHCPARAPADLQLLPARANGQPAVGMYLRRDDVYLPFQFQVLDVDGSGRVSSVCGWFDARWFRLAGLPLRLEASAHA